MAPPNDIVELRAFLSGLTGQGHRPSVCLPTRLRRLALRVTHGDESAAEDLVGDVLLDFLERRGQAGAIERLLELDDRGLLAGLRRRLMQVRTSAVCSRSRLLKALRAHVAAALETSATSPGGPFPLSLLAGNHLSTGLVREAVAALLSEADAPTDDPRALASNLTARYFEPRPEDFGANDQHGNHRSVEAEAVRRFDTNRHAERLHRELGNDLRQVVARRAAGMSLAEVGAGLPTSTVHDQLRRAVRVVRLYAERHDLAAEDLEAVLAALAT